MKNEHDTARDIVGLLEESTRQLDRKIVARLADARQQAVAAMQAQAPIAAGSSGLGHLILRYMGQHRFVMPTAMMCGAVLLAFIVTQQFTGLDSHEQGDAFLLASDLPPEAYLDQGFDEWLERTSQH
jgi:hypothetical protein